ncbi:MAG: hypothetical protein AAF636_19360 [Pseudomonadota bacterium]
MTSAATYTASRSLPPQQPVARGAAASHLHRLSRLRDALAQRILDDPVYVPVFQRLEDEIALAEAITSGDPLTQARAIARQIATR